MHKNRFSAGRIAGGADAFAGKPAPTGFCASANQRNFCGSWLASDEAITNTTKTTETPYRLPATLVATSAGTQGFQTCG
ncbi:hypothetical protein EJA70_26635 [Pseudomonas sp. PB103]|nr:hypothetical protein EJA70_26635 [Pseudomonas sp. PB103]